MLSLEEMSGGDEVVENNEKLSPLLFAFLPIKFVLVTLTVPSHATNLFDLYKTVETTIKYLLT
jgi:hypothetical protein